MYTFQNAPKDYFGPVRLTPAQKDHTALLTDQWIQTLIGQANDGSDPETQANARLLLTNRGVDW